MNLFSDEDLFHLKWQIEQEISKRSEITQLNMSALKIYGSFPGDSLPFPKVTKEELDRELSDIYNANKFIKEICKNQLESNYC